MKVILIILGIIFVLITIVSAYTNGFIRALRLMSQHKTKRTGFEKHLIKHAFEQKVGDIDPYFQSIYMKHEYKDYKKEVEKEIKKEKTIKSKKKKNVK